MTKPSRFFSFRDAQIIKKISIVSLINLGLCLYIGKEEESSFISLNYCLLLLWRNSISVTLEHVCSISALMMTDLPGKIMFIAYWLSAALTHWTNPVLIWVYISYWPASAKGRSHRISGNFLPSINQFVRFPSMINDLCVYLCVFLSLGNLLPLGYNCIFASDETIHNKRSRRRVFWLQSSYNELQASCSRWHLWLFLLCDGEAPAQADLFFCFVFFDLSTRYYCLFCIYIYIKLRCSLFSLCVLQILCGPLSVWKEIFGCRHSQELKYLGYL